MTPEEVMKGVNEVVEVMGLVQANPKAFAGKPYDSLFRSMLTTVNAVKSVAEKLPKESK